MGLSLLNSCCWMSLRTVSIIIGVIILLLSTMYMIMSMTYGIMYVHRKNDTDQAYQNLVEMMSYDYTASTQIVFSVFLIYGCIKEISCFTLSWILCEIGVLTTSLIQCLFLLIVHFFIWYEDAILIVLLGISLYIVYSYYDKMKKPQAI